MKTWKRSGGSLALLLLWGCGGGPLNPLISAARSGNVERIRELVRSGADPNERGGVNDWTPLMHAVHKAQHGSAKALLAVGADPNAFGGDSTPLIMAAGYGDAEMVRLLLDGGAKPRITSRQGVSALAAAISGTPDIDNFTVGRCQTTTVKLLLDRDPSLQLSGDSWS
jgi:ankyrin repeat protein